MFEYNSVCILTDVSNHSQKKIALMIHYFIPSEKVKTKILEFDKFTGKRILKIIVYISNILTKWRIEKKL